MTSSILSHKIPSLVDKDAIFLTLKDEVKSRPEPVQNRYLKFPQSYDDAFSSLHDELVQQRTSGTRTIYTAWMRLFVVERENLKQAIQDLLDEAGDEDWDGEGALPLRQETVDAAIRFVDLVPGDIPDPDVTATPQGEVDFDWTINRQLMLTVSIGADHEITFAGLFDGARLNGQEPWTGTMPGFVTCCFERLRGCLG